MINLYKGIAGSDGVGIGEVVIIKEPELKYERASALTVEKELERFNKAIEELVEKTNAMSEEVRKSAGEAEAEILLGHVMIMSDPALSDEVRSLISDGLTAEAAAEQVLDMFAAIYEGTGDELTMQRATDIRDVKTRLIKALLGAEDVDISALKKGSVIVVHDLTPSMTAGIVKENIEGIITETGGKTSHSAILARALEIPAVLSIDNITELLKNGQSVIVDGIGGEVIPDPDDKCISEYRAKREEHIKHKRELLKLIGCETHTADGIHAELVCNIGKPADCKDVLERDGEGVGLFRTEFLYMDTDRLPTEDQQFEAYRAAAAAMDGKPVIIRTLDVGGDKEIPYLGLEKEDNPFLGYRAVRYCLKNPELYRAQLRALIRASAFGNIKIMAPLVTCVDEIRAVKALVKELMAELESEGIDFDRNIEVGVMIETPAAAVIADLLAAEADFFSIGTNDLTGYTMAVDRGNHKVAYLYSVYNPAVLRSIKRVIECGVDAGIMVGMCGEAASDPLLIPLLISFGLNEYSVSPTSVLATRAEILKWSKSEADKVAEEALSCTTESEVKDVLSKYKK